MSVPRILFSLLGLGLCLIAPQLSAADFYVDSTASLASDENPGSEALPWLSIQHATQTAQAGDTIWVMPGVYRESITFANPGTEEAPITLRAIQADNKPALDGSVLIDHWSSEDGVIYTTDVQDAPSRLYQDGTRLPLSMQPNAPDPEDPYNHSTWYDIQEADVVASGSDEEAAMIDAGVEYLYLPEDLANLQGNPLPDDFWLGASLYHYNHYQNRTLIHEVLAYDADTRRLTVNLIADERYARLLAPTSRHDRYALANHPALIDEPGEYSIQDTQISLRPLEDQLGSISGSLLNVGINLTQPNIRIENFEIRNYTSHGIEDTFRNHADNFTLIDAYIHHNGGTGFTSRESKVTHIENCEFSYNDRNGISFGSNTGDIVILNNYVHHNNDNGIWLGSGGGQLYYCRNVLIKGNRVVFQGSSQSHPDNIQFQQVADMIIEDNYLEQTGHQNLWCQANGRVTFRRNVIRNGNIGFCHMSPVYIYNNVFESVGLRFDAHQGSLGAWQVSLSNLGIYWMGWEHITDLIQGDIEQFPLSLLLHVDAPIIEDIRNLPEGTTLADQDDAFRQRLVDHLNAIIQDPLLLNQYPEIIDSLDVEGSVLHILQAMHERGILSAQNLPKENLTAGETEELYGLNRIIIEELVLRPYIEPSAFNYRQHVAILRNNVLLSCGISGPPSELEMVPYFSIGYNYLNVSGQYTYNGWENMGGTDTSNIIQRNPLLAEQEFTDPAAGDFSLLGTSHLIDAGTDVGLDYQGFAPDIGMEETALLSTPTWSEIQGLYDQIELAWDHSWRESIEHYELWRATSTDGPWQLIQPELSDTAYIDELVLQNQDYYYRLRAFAGENSSVASAIRRGRAVSQSLADDFEDTAGNTALEKLQQADESLDNGATWQLHQGNATLSQCGDCGEAQPTTYLRVGLNQSEPSSLISDQQTTNAFTLNFDLIHKYVVGEQGLYLLYQDTQNFYQLTINRDVLQLSRVVDGVATIIGESGDLGTQHPLSVAHYSVTVLPKESGIEFTITKSDWVRLQDPENPIHDNEVYSATFVDEDELSSRFNGGAIGIFQNRLNTYNIAGYDNITVTELYQPATTYESWVEQYLAQYDDADTLPSADPDQDQLINLLEYAHGLDPSLSDHHSLTPGQANLGGLPRSYRTDNGSVSESTAFAYFHRIDPALHYRYERLDPTTGTWSPAIITLQSRMRNGDDTEQRSFKADLEHNDGKAIYRLVIELDE